MSELTLLLLKLGFLALLWMLVWASIRLLRSDLFGTRVHIPKLTEAAEVAVVNKIPESSLNATVVSVGNSKADTVDIPLLPPRMLIGRNPDCQILVTDSFASGQHAELALGNSGWTVKDLDSSNGTMVGGRLISPGRAVTVSLDTPIKIGNTVIKLRNL